MADEFKWAMQNGDLNKVEEIIGKDKAVCNTVINGRPPLNIAADYGQTEVIKVLLDNGANINQEDNHNITPLLSAIFESHTAAVELLLSRGADKSGKAPDGSSYYEAAETQAIKDLLK